MFKILVVDDDQFVLDMLQRKLVRSGYAVTIAGNGMEALKFFESNPPDLVLTDMAMPDMDGMALIEELQRLYPIVKIIAMSGDERHQPAKHSPADVLSNPISHLIKPFGGDELLAAIRVALGA